MAATLQSRKPWLNQVEIVWYGPGKINESISSSIIYLTNRNQYHKTLGWL